ncbi:MAG: UDP-N-acetylmuramate dehydrogenase [Minisyncoccia bacterium]|jgi:UDP-N-acetylmuramate dehydrogenase
MTHTRIEFKENVPLAEHTTFKIGGPARFFCRPRSEDELVEAVRFAEDRKLRLFVLGGGSNVLISDEGFPGLVVKIELLGVEYKEGGDSTEVSAAAGEMWDGLVAKTVERGLYGLENLSAIPGTVGAAPVQNIGAYGSEAADSIVSVRALDRKAMKYVVLSNADCRFGYRDSIFKKDKDRYVISRVIFRLSNDGRVNIGYKDLAERFKQTETGALPPTLAEVRDAVIDIRWNKLPDWKLWGTAGSFFKNPIVDKDKWDELKAAYPDLPGFPEPDGRVKVSLGWILDKLCGAKSLCVGGARVYEKQALVVVAKPGATAAEVVDLSRELMKRVKGKTGIEVSAEVEWVN